MADDLSFDLYGITTDPFSTPSMSSKMLHQASVNISPYVGRGMFKPLEIRLDKALSKKADKNNIDIALDFTEG